jgi:enamine deaminase RidA (YjgF/YER057c/UK114 family)
MPQDALLRLETLPLPELARRLRDGRHRVLGGACFSSLPGVRDEGELPLATVNMSPATGEASICEIWHSAEPLTSGRHGRIRYRRSETLLFGSIGLGETAADARSPLRATTENAYRAIFELLDSLGYSAVMRFWNYFPAINLESHGMERYRQFNVGRQDAFLAHGRSVSGNVPAACALGSAGGDLQIAFLAARATASGIENPRQVSAYRYPSDYGPRSPTFSRASLVELGGRPMLFISGTASIVGHRTLHDGDAAAQTRECMDNIAAIVEVANGRAPQAGFRLDRLAYKVYVRRAGDVPAVQREIVRIAGGQAAAIYLLADVCRSDLLVEIEASGGHAIGRPQDAG